MQLKITVKSYELL